MSKETDGATAELARLRRTIRRAVAGLVALLVAGGITLFVVTRPDEPSLQECFEMALQGQRSDAFYEHCV